MDYAKESLRLHQEWAGKIEVTARAPAADAAGLSLALLLQRILPKIRKNKFSKNEMRSSSPPPSAKTPSSPT